MASSLLWVAKIIVFFNFLSLRKYENISFEVLKSKLPVGSSAKIRFVSAIKALAIARALIAETMLILADEPTGNLDFKTSKEIFSLFLKLKKLKKTIIFATHNRELANRADYKLFISDGDIKRVNAR